MTVRTVSIALVTMAALLGTSVAHAISSGTTPARVLRIAADPDNLPFSNRSREGFENRIAALLAGDLHAEIRYTWHRQRQGFFRVAFKEDTCDLVMGVPAGFERALPTIPYYRSTYVLVARRDRRWTVHSLDDPALASRSIAVQVIGADGANTPPTQALARRGLGTNMRGYMVYGDGTADPPAKRMIRAVEDGSVDLALAWGPTAGFYSRGSPSLELAPIEPPADGGLPMAFDISIGVRRGEPALRDELSAAIARHHAEIESILREYGVPLLPIQGAGTVGER